MYDAVTRNLEGPYCECGSCDATGRRGGPPVRLPAAAWAVAGYGDLDALAVAPGHETAYERAAYVIEHHDGWLAIFEADHDDWPIHQPGPATDAPIPGVHWYGGCEPGYPRVNPLTGICEGCGEAACRECGRENCPDHSPQEPA